MITELQNEMFKFRATRDVTGNKQTTADLIRVTICLLCMYSVTSLATLNHVQYKQ